MAKQAKMAYRAYSSSLIRSIIACLFSNIFKVCTFFPTFSNILPLFNISLAFSEKLHPCPYFLE